MNTLSFLAQHGNLISVTVAGTGPTVILLHGFPLDHRMWQSQLKSLAKGYQVIAPDLRGFGRSSLSAHSYSIAELADDMELIRQHFASDKQISLVGLSMGGYVAFEYWKRHGQHLSSMILASTKPTADNDAAREARYDMSAKAKKVGGWSAVSAMLEKLLSTTSLAQPSEIADLTTQIMRDCTPDAIAAAQHAMARRQDFTCHLPSIQTPTLVLTGQHDVIAPPDETARWAARMANCQFETIPGAAHLSPLESPVEFNQHVVDFLQSVT